MNRDEELNRALEAMHFGFRAMTDKPDKRLAKLKLTRIHHRLLYFIARNSSCSVNELLGVMKITKQYLNRPLKTLIERDYIAQKNDPDDKRVKRLTLTAKGKKLEFDLTDVQRQAFDNIFNELGPKAEKHWHEVMKLLAQRVSF